VNVNGLHNVLEVARTNDVNNVIVPSSIAVFGSETPPDPTEYTILNPNTMYGISKIVSEQLGDYYSDRYDLDVRGMRFPGILSHKTRPSGGTTDFAVEVFYQAFQDHEYTFFVRPDTTLPMIYMPDAINAIIDLFEANSTDLRYRSRYNVSSLSFPAEALAEEIQRQWRPFDVTYEPDHRQAIADSWPASLNDSAAREDWGWEPTYGFTEMVSEMIENIGEPKPGLDRQDR
jgi:nucleoside-diphosphate-sugar epimerase